MISPSLDESPARLDLGEVGGKRGSLEHAGEIPKLPNRITGGFRGLTDEVERRNRDLALMARALEQHRVQLEAAERERQRISAKLPQALTAVQDTERAVAAAVEKAQARDLSADLTAVFTKNARALDDLEKLSSELNSNRMWWRSCWEQYARSMIGAHRLREEMRSDRS